MKNNKYSLYKFIFGIVSLLQLLSILIESYELRFVTKLLICPALILIVYAVKGRLSKENKWLVMGLLCCFLGDLFLLFEREIFFLLGLGSFFIGHVFYCIQFSRTQKLKENRILITIGLIVIIAYASSIFKILKNHVGDLQLPIITYICIISIMFLFAIARYRTVTKSSFLWVIIGALLFIISDSILAINQFAYPISYGNFWVMISYIAAQFCITTGIIARNVVQPLTQIN